MCLGLFEGHHDEEDVVVYEHQPAICRRGYNGKTFSSVDLGYYEAFPGGEHPNKFVGIYEIS